MAKRRSHLTVGEKRNLEEYERKRDFAATPGAARTQSTCNAQEDCRRVSSCRSTTRERCTGTSGSNATACSSSWAVPKGIPSDPKRNHLAVRTEDHPMEYLTFEGDIPKGEYGGGSMRVWDTGTYETYKWDDREVMITLHGERVQGRYVLFRTRGDQWMIHRMDPPAGSRGFGPAREPAADARDARQGPAGGRRLGVGAEVGRHPRPRLRRRRAPAPRHAQRQRRDAPISRNCASSARRSARAQAVLDGEIVTFDDAGRPSFERLQRRMHVDSDSSDPPARQRSAGRVRAVRPALVRPALDDGTAVRAAARAAHRRSGSPARRGRRRRTRSATATRRSR